MSHSTQKLPYFGSFGSHPPKGGDGKEPKRFLLGSKKEPKGIKGTLFVKVWYETD